MAKTAQPGPAAPLNLQSNISVQRYFEVSLLLTLATGFITLTTTGKLDFVSTLAVSGALAVKLWSHAPELPDDMTVMIARGINVGHA